MQALDVPGEFEKFVVTLLVMRSFSNFSGASRACADFRDPTAVSRIIDVNRKFNLRPGLDNMILSRFLHHTQYQCLTINILLSSSI